jgi:hypothetical protein
MLDIGQSLGSLLVLQSTIGLLTSDHNRRLDALTNLQALLEQKLQNSNILAPRGKAGVARLT